MNPTTDFTPQTVISDQLQYGEKVLWVGKPMPSRVALHNAPMLITIAVSMFIIVYAFISRASRGSDRRVFLDTNAQLILIIAFVLAIAFAILGPTLEARRAKSTVYGITNRRVVIITSAKGSEPEVFSCRGLVHMKRRDLSNGRGDLVFTNVVLREVEGYYNGTIYAGLFGVENVEEVERLIMEVLPGSTSTPAKYTL